MDGGENGDGDYRLGGGRRPSRGYPAAEQDPGPSPAAPARDEQTGRFRAAPARDKETGRFRAAPARDEQTGRFRAAPARDEQTGRFRAAPARDEEAGLSENGGAADWPPAPGAGTAADPDATQRLFGLIVIYSLAEGQDANFDALAERVVEEVRVSEPDTLVYAVHSVPNAPMQRIFYEVYRDETAYADHRQYAHIQRFDAERGPCVLTTNVIQLGTQRAKLSALPGLSQLLRANPGE